MAAFNNTKTNEELNIFFDKITNKFGTLKKLVKIVSNITEEKRINNMIKGVRFVLDYVASLGTVIVVVIVNQVFLILTLVIQKGVD